MSIPVICPGCHKSFKVSDKFAGKSGACPSCKTTIDVPEKGQEVKVHAPAAFAEGGRSTSGKLITKPIARKQVRLEPVTTAAILGYDLYLLDSPSALYAFEEHDLDPVPTDILRSAAPFELGIRAFNLLNSNFYDIGQTETTGPDPLGGFRLRRRIFLYVRGNL